MATLDELKQQYLDMTRKNPGADTTALKQDVNKYFRDQFSATNTLTPDTWKQAGEQANQWFLDLANQQKAEQDNTLAGLGGGDVGTAAVTNLQRYASGWTPKSETSQTAWDNAIQSLKDKGYIASSGEVNWAGGQPTVPGSTNTTTAGSGGKSTTGYEQAGGMQPDIFGSTAGTVTPTGSTTTTGTATGSNKTITQPAYSPATSSDEWNQVLARYAAEQMSNPNPYNADVVQSGIAAIDSALANMRQKGYVGLAEEAAQRGLVGSSIEGQNRAQFEADLQNYGLQRANELKQAMANAQLAGTSNAFGFGLGAANLLTGQNQFAAQLALQKATSGRQLDQSELALLIALEKEYPGVLAKSGIDVGSLIARGGGGGGGGSGAGVTQLSGGGYWNNGTTKYF